MSLQLRLHLHGLVLLIDSQAYDWCLTVAFPPQCSLFDAGLWKSNRNESLAQSCSVAPYKLRPQHDIQMPAAS